MEFTPTDRHNQLIYQFRDMPCGGIVNQKTRQNGYSEQREREGETERETDRQAGRQAGRKKTETECWYSSFKHNQTLSLSVHGGWSQWPESGRTQCSKTCGTGNQTITEARTCTNPCPSGIGTSPYSGDSRRTSTHDCNSQACAGEYHMCSTVTLLTGTSIPCILNIVYV